MARKNKNLLEAFTASQSEEKAPDTTPGARKLPARVAGPFASSRSESPVQAAPVPTANPDWLERFLSHPFSLPIAMLLLGVLLGRASVGKVEAEAPDETAATRVAGSGRTDPGSGDRSAKPTRQVSSPGAASKEDRAGLVARGEEPSKEPEIALFAPENRYTVLAVRYVASREDIGWKAYRYLQEEGFDPFPLYRQPDSDYLFLFIGAEVDIADLDKTLERLQNTPGPNGNAGDFASAYVVRIDQFVDRNAVVQH